MSRGFYTIASGMITQKKIIDSVSNNISNLQTPGFKREEIVTTTFGDLMLSKLQGSSRDELAMSNPLSVVDETFIDHTQGVLKETGNKTDLALQGKGYFKILTNKDDFVYTRNGNFRIDQEGYLAFQDVGRVVGTDGLIYVGTDSFEVDASGNVFVGDKKVNKISVKNFVDDKQVEKIGQSLFRTDNINVKDTESKVIQNNLETANVEMTDELTKIMASQNAFQSYSQVIKMFDNINGKVVNDLGKV